MPFQTVRSIHEIVSEQTLTHCILAEAQYNTQMYGRRPYGVGFLVAGYDVSR